MRNEERHEEGAKKSEDGRHLISRSTCSHIDSLEKTQRKHERQENKKRKGSSLAYGKKE